MTTPPGHLCQRLLYSVTDAAGQLSIPAGELEQLLAEGQVRTVRLAGRQLVAHADLEAFIYSLRTGAKFTDGEAQQVEALGLSANRKLAAGAAITAAELAALLGLDVRTVNRQAMEAATRRSNPPAPAGRAASPPRT